jgi:hypothetical protein
VTDENSSSQLVLLYEPEAAALTTCGQTNVTVDAGERFLILDAGGRAGAWLCRLASLTA